MGALNPYVAVGALAVAFGCGWAVNGWRVGAEIDRLNAYHATAAKNASEAAAADLKTRTDERDALQAQLSAGAAAARTQLEKANAETERLRRCVARGDCGLRIAAVCPSAPAGVPQAPGGGVVDPGPGAVLAPAAQQDYFALRANIERTEATLAACQDGLSRVSERK